MEDELGVSNVLDREPYVVACSIDSIPLQYRDAEP